MAACVVGDETDESVVVCATEISHGVVGAQRTSVLALGEEEKVGGVDGAGDEGGRGKDGEEGSEEDGVQHFCGVEFCIVVGF